jgi:hypothetical protein
VWDECHVKLNLAGWANIACPLLYFFILTNAMAHFGEFKRKTTATSESMAIKIQNLQILMIFCT